MALINCTHIVAYLSENSRESWWIPYEYGRVKDAKIFFSRACAWNTLKPEKNEVFPEYMYLGIICENEDGVTKWLEKEKKIWHTATDCQPEDFPEWVKKIFEEIEEEKNRKIIETVHIVKQDIPAAKKLRLGLPERKTT